MVCFHCPTPVPIHTPIPILILCRKAPLGRIQMVILMQSYYENYLKNHLISTNISVEIRYSTHLHQNRNWNRFSGNSSAHCYISHLNRNWIRHRHRNQSRAVETHHYTQSNLFVNYLTLM